MKNDHVCAYKRTKAFLGKKKKKKKTLKKESSLFYIQCNKVTNLVHIFHSYIFLLETTIADTL